MKFRLRFPTADIAYWAARYDYPGEEEVENDLAPAVKRQGYLTRVQFLRICEWKTPRSRKRCAENDEEFVREVTHLALSAKHNSVKIGILRALRGVEWPTASVILHFCDSLPSPILDFRALWSLGIDKAPNYTYRFWAEYTAYVRDLSASSGHSMRTIDKALWQYSKENQKNL